MNFAKLTSIRHQKGFTLVELLVVIAVIGVLAIAVVVAIDPLDKLHAADDSKVQGDIAQLASAMENYAVTHNGAYATTQAILVTAGELKVALNDPSGVAYTVNGGAAGTIFHALQSKKYTATPVWGWCSSTGRAGATTGTTCP